MRYLTTILATIGVLAGVGLSQKAETKFTYDTSRTDVYLAQVRKPGTPAGKLAESLAARMKAEVLELAEKDWGPYHVHSKMVNQYNNRFSYFNCPDELLVALAMARPYLDAEGQAAAVKAADREFAKHSPIDTPWRPIEGQLRGWHDLPEPELQRHKNGPWMSPRQRAAAELKTCYGIWAYASSFDRWDEVRKIWPKIKQRRKKLADWDFNPEWNKKTPEGPGKLTAETAADGRYQHELLRFWTVGTHGIYHNNPPRDESTITVYAQFGYTKLLSGLIGYARLAEHFGEPEEARWARQKFEHVAGQTLSWRTAPMYWSSPWLVPEVARLIDDHAGEWAGEILARSNIYKGTDKDGFETPGPHYRVIDPHHWYVTHLGSNGAQLPCGPMSGFLVRAYFTEPTDKQIATWVDIPWAQADYWFIQKCAVALDRIGRGGWQKTDD